MKYPEDSQKRIILAFDLAGENCLKQSEQLLKKTGLCSSAHSDQIIKFGLAAIMRIGPLRIKKWAQKNGFLVMLDSKLHDIPNTMADAVKGIADQNFWGFTVHASAGRNGLKAAAYNRGRSNMIGVTVLTSHSEEECISIYGNHSKEKIYQFAEWILEAGGQAVVCSPCELEILRGDSRFDALTVMTPGIRMENSPRDDQMRKMTPREAAALGADYLIVGRPVIEAQNPKIELEKIVSEARAGFDQRREKLKRSCQ